MATVLRLGVTPALAVRLRRLARAWVLVALVATQFGALLRNWTSADVAQEWEPAAWLAAVVALAIAAATMWWSDGLTTAWLVVIGTAAGVGMASVYSVWMGLAPVAVCYPPALMFGLAWQHVRSGPAVVAFVAVLGVLLAGGGLAASAAHDAVYGPTHPASNASPSPDGPVRWMWSGAVTPSGFTVVAALEDPGAVRLEVASAGTIVAVVDVDAPGPHPVGEFAVTGLDPATEYTYRVITGRGPGPDGRVRTFPEGPAPVRLAFSSCARLGSNGAVFDAIAAADPDVYVITGDWFYADIGPDDPGAFAEAYETTLTRPGQAALYRSVPIAYVWDDHDYGRNDSDMTSPSRPAAEEMYRRLTPHYPLAAETSTIHQSFVIGRIRVVMTDLRSGRTAAGILGVEQTAWFEAQLAEAAAAHQLVLWVSPVPWITPDDPTGDDWGGFPEERRAVAETIASSGAAVVMLGGDAHMLAIDDGTHNTFAGSAGFPVFHAGALDRPGSVKGGPYSHGSRGGGGQWGLVEVSDDGTTMQVTLRGMDWTGAIVMEYSFRVTP